MSLPQLFFKLPLPEFSFLSLFLFSVGFFSVLKLLTVLLYERLTAQISSSRNTVEIRFYGDILGRLWIVLTRRKNNNNNKKLPKFFPHVHRIHTGGESKQFSFLCIRWTSVVCMFQIEVLKKIWKKSVNDALDTFRLLYRRLYSPTWRRGTKKSKWMIKMDMWLDVIHHHSPRGVILSERRRRYHFFFAWIPNTQHQSGVQLVRFSEKNQIVFWVFFWRVKMVI